MITKIRATSDLSDKIEPEGSASFTKTFALEMNYMI